MWVCHAICTHYYTLVLYTLLYTIKNLKRVFCANCIAKIMVQFCYLRLYLGIGTVSCRLLIQMARMDMEWNLKLRREMSNSAVFWRTQTPDDSLSELGYGPQEFNPSRIRLHSTNWSSWNNCALVWRNANLLLKWCCRFNRRSNIFKQSVDLNPNH